MVYVYSEQVFYMHFKRRPIPVYCFSRTKNVFMQNTNLFFFNTDQVCVFCLYLRPWDIQPILQLNSTKIIGLWLILETSIKSFIEVMVWFRNILNKPIREQHMYFSHITSEERIMFTNLMRKKWKYIIYINHLNKLWYYDICWRGLILKHLVTACFTLQKSDIEYFGVGTLLSIVRARNKFFPRGR